MDNESLKRGVLRSFSQNFAGKSVNTVSSVLSGYFFALFLGPGLYGIWQTARVFFSYSTFTSLGIPFVIRRDFITLRSEGREEEAQKMAHVAMTYSFIVNPIIAIIFIVITVFSKSEMAFRVSLLVVGLRYITDLFSGIGVIIHPGLNDYKTLSQGDFIYSVGLLLLVPLVYFFGFYALLWGYLGLSLVKSAFFYVQRPIPYKWVWDYPLLKSMVFTAFPIFLVTLSSTLFATIDRLLIAGLMNFENVGLYSLSSFIAQPVTLLISSFSIVLFTHLNQYYGKSTNPKVIDKHVYIPQQFFSKLLSPLIGIGVIIIPVLTQVFLPRYSGGVMAAQISVFAILFIKLANFSSNGLFVLDKQKYTALSFFIAGVIKTIGSYFALKSGFGIEGVALFTLLAYFVFNAMQIYHINRSLNNSFNAFLKNLSNSLIAPLTTLVFCTIYITYSPNTYSYFGIESQWIQMGVGVLLMGMIGFPFLYQVTKDFKHIFLK